MAKIEFAWELGAGTDTAGEAARQAPAAGEDAGGASGGGGEQVGKSA